MRTHIEVRISAHSIFICHNAHVFTVLIGHFDRILIKGEIIICILITPLIVQVLRICAFRDDFECHGLLPGIRVDVNGIAVSFILIQFCTIRVNRKRFFFRACVPVKVIIDAAAVSIVVCNVAACVHNSSVQIRLRNRIGVCIFTRQRIIQIIIIIDTPLIVYAVRICGGGNDSQCPSCHRLTFIIHSRFQFPGILCVGRETIVNNDMERYCPIGAILVGHLAFISCTSISGSNIGDTICTIDHVAVLVPGKGKSVSDGCRRSYIQRDVLPRFRINCACSVVDPAVALLAHFQVIINSHMKPGRIRVSVCILHLAVVTPGFVDAGQHSICAVFQDLIILIPLISDPFCIERFRNGREICLFPGHQSNVYRTIICSLRMYLEFVVHLYIEFYGCRIVILIADRAAIRGIFCCRFDCIGIGLSSRAFDRFIISIIIVVVYIVF